MTGTTMHPTAANIALQAAQMARREHPATQDPRVDRIAAREHFLWKFAKDQPTEAAEVVRELHANPEAYVEHAGVSPERIHSYGTIIQNALALPA